MTEFSQSRLHGVLDELIKHSSAQLCISLSGGLDSMVLLHAIAQLRSERKEWSVRAVHINHQLQSASGNWAQHCLEECEKLRVPCKVLTVQVVDIKQQGLEAAARQARYAALCAELAFNEVLLTAHHADDQLETILIALMRGAGLDGLCAMPSIARFEHAWHARPMLEFTRDSLQAWARSNQVSFIDDPSNAQSHLDRNFLRHEIVQQMKQRWPAASVTAARSAAHLSEAQHLLDEYIAQDASHALRDNALNVEVLREWPAPRRRAAIRNWLKQNNVLMPSTRVLHAMEHDMLMGANDRVPCSRWGDYAVHRFDGWLYLETHYRPETLDTVMTWHSSERLELPHQLGALELTRHPDLEGLWRLDATRLANTQLVVRFRHGGERIKLPGDKIHRELKTLLHGARVLPWWRGRIPLVFSGDNLVAVADLWVSADYVAITGQPALQLRWVHEDFLIAARQ